MEPTERVLELAHATLDDFDRPDVRLSTITQRALRIARLRRDYTGIWWLTREVAGIMDDAARERLRAELAPHFTEEKWKQVNSWVGEMLLKERESHGLKPDGEYDPEAMVMSGSVAEIEDAIARLHAVREAQPPVEPGGLDILLMGIAQHQTILGRIRHRVHEYLSQTEEQLMYGQLLSDIFEQNRVYVDERLRTRSPDTYEQLTSAYRRLRDGSAEGRSHAVLSCRRALKSLRYERKLWMRDLVMGVAYPPVDR